MFRHAYLWLVVAISVSCPALGANTAFTYQGKLTDAAGVGMTGSCDMTFKLYDALTGGVQVGSTVSLTDLSVAGGLFTVQLDFGAVWNGQDRWLETTVEGKTLTPRTQVTSAPSALFSAAPWITSGNSISYSLGSVGIGTFDLAPSLPLTIQGSGTNCEWIQLRGIFGADEWHLNARGGGLNLAETGSGDYRLYIKPGGDVGIGTSTPAAKLDVTGTVKMTGFQLGSSATSGQVLTANASGVGTWQAPPASLPPSGSAGGDLAGTYPNPTVGLDKIGSTKLTSDAASLAKVSGGAMVSSSGKVGIGTGSPSQKLSVYGGELCLQTPDNLVDQSILFQNSGGAYTWRIYRGDAGNNQADLRIAGTGTQTDPSALTDILTLSNKGNVGIGTTDPQAILDVNGRARMTGLVASAEEGVSIGADWTYGSPFQVYSPTYTVDQQQLTFAGSQYTSGTQWQSFTAGASGELAAIHLFVGLYGGGRWSGTLKVFSGEGTGGTLLTSQTIVADGFAYRLFTLNSPVAVTSGSQYTIAITPSGAVIDWKRITSDVYAGGRFSASATYDAYFITYVSTGNASPSLVVQPNTGNVGVNTDNPTYKLHVNGSVAGVGAYNQLSDAKYKTNVLEIPRALEKVERLRGVTFDWRQAEYPGIEFDNARQAGLIAQEVEKVLPEAVTRDGIGNLSISYSSLIPLLIEGMKEQQKQMDSKDACIADLEARLSRIERLLEESTRE